MAELIKSVLVGLMASLWLTTGAVAMEQPLDMRSHSQADDMDTASVLIIAPELTNPAEIPLAESEPAPPSIWFSDDALTAARLAPPSADDKMETTLEKWLSSVKRFFEGR